MFGIFINDCWQTKKTKLMVLKCSRVVYKNKNLYLMKSMVVVKLKYQFNDSQIFKYAKYLLNQINDYYQIRILVK